MYPIGRNGKLNVNIKKVNSNSKDNKDLLDITSQCSVVEDEDEVDPIFSSSQYTHVPNQYSTYNEDQFLD